GRSRVESVLATADALPADLSGRLHRLYGGVLVLGGEVAQGEKQVWKAIELFRSVGYERGVVELQARFVVHRADDTDPDEMGRRIAALREANRTAGAPMVEPQLFTALATLARREGDVNTARDLLGRSIEAAEACNFVLWEMWMLSEKAGLEHEL